MLFIGGEFLGVEGLADGFPDEGDEQERDHQGGEGGGDHPACGEVRQAVIEQAPPAGVRIRQAKAQVVQGSQGQDQGGDTEWNQRDQNGHQVREDVDEEDAAGGGPQHTGGRHVVPRLFLHGGGPELVGHGHPPEHDEQADDQEHALHLKRHHV